VKKNKEKKNYQGGKRIFLNLGDLLREEVYYKRIDTDSIVASRFERIWIDEKGNRVWRKLFVKGDDEEKEFEYKYIDEKGKIYNGEVFKALLDKQKNKIIKLGNSKRLIEYMDLKDIFIINDYLIEKEYIIYPIFNSKTNLTKIAKMLYENGKCIVCKFNPEGDFVGLGFLYAKKKENKYALIIAYARFLKENHLIWFEENKEELIENVELFEISDKILN